ncbi:MAG: DUF58 domain-containing protein [Spirochaetaceae bacterium]|nr:MAG: DUF58 domain-containing protein [Spirochaetaceae bacterium]
MRTGFRSIVTKFPLTLIGTALFAIGVYLLGVGFSLRNPYAVFLSFTIIFGLAALVVIGRVNAKRFETLTIQWETSAPVYARRSAPAHAVVGIERRAPFLFRVHFSIRGRISVGDGCSVAYHDEVASVGGERQPIAYDAPVAGVLEARARLSLRDVFGLTRNRFGGSFTRRIPIRPAAFDDERLYRVQAVVGAEDKQSRKTADEERYYMREYVPGDRFRDINWKSSSRLAILLTRISPNTQEKSRIITVVFRSLPPGRVRSLDRIVHLDFSKSWTVSFMRKVKEENPDFQFDLVVGENVTRIETESEIETAAEILAAATTEPSTPSAAIESREAFIFTTPFDDGLAAFLIARGDAVNHVHATAFPEKGSIRSVRTVRFFRPASATVIPGAWALRRERVGRSTPAGGRVEREVLDVRLA